MAEVADGVSECGVGGGGIGLLHQYSKNRQ
jgi:hypothetical protein